MIAYKDELWDILIDCEVSTPPNERNFKELMIEAAKKQFVQKPFYILKKMQVGLGDFWNNLAINEIDDIWESYKANSFNILKCFHFGSAVTPSEENVLAHLKRFLRNAPEETLALVLHFCTGISTIDNLEKIKIIFVNQDSRSYYTSAKSCFKIYTYLNELKVPVGLIVMGRYPTKPFQLGHGGLILELLVYV